MKRQKYVKKKQTKKKNFDAHSPGLNKRLTGSLIPENTTNNLVSRHLEAEKEKKNNITIISNEKLWNKHVWNFSWLTNANAARATFPSSALTSYTHTHGAWTDALAWLALAAQGHPALSDITASLW